ncbi:Protein MCM10-like [Vitis vinifera]|uniref:Protein MCM10-like n=1 Tax=Vitis vinifera TaxID=29760 RepID=A0A438IIY0_VITVI|nr:Protein MCM10-like [Vitis vinifera]
MSNHQEDLDLLLSLEDRVLETPPHSPVYAQALGVVHPFQASICWEIYDTFLMMDLQREQGSQTCLSSEMPSKIVLILSLNLNQLVSSVELSSQFSDIRFVRLSAIKNLLVGDTLSGCWATVGVLTEKGNPKTSSAGKNYCIWKIGCLDEDTVSVFLFGDAYQKNWKEQAGTVFALFNCSVRKDAMGNGFSLSVYSPGQILKLGTSVDYGVCKGKRKDGMACTLVINKYQPETTLKIWVQHEDMGLLYFRAYCKYLLELLGTLCDFRRRGVYCRYHKSKASEKYSIMRTELKGGNLKTAFRDPLNSKGVYLVDPLADKTNVKRPMQPLKLLSVDGLKKALSNAGKVTTNAHSQGIRFLTEITGKVGSKITKEGSGPNQQVAKRPSTTIRTDSSAVARNQQPGTKRKKMEQEQPSSGKAKMATEKMIELEFVSSDEEF